MRSKNDFDIFTIKKINKDNFDKFFDNRNNNLFQVAIT